MLFVILSILVSLGVFTNIDYSTTIALQSLIPDFLTTPFSVFSLIGTFEVLTLILLVSLFLLPGVKKIYVLILFALVSIIEIAGKTYINHKPPPLNFLKTDISIGLPSNGIVHEFFSYPSGHSARTAFVSGFIILMVLTSKKLTSTQKKIFIGGVLIFDLIMFVSRVYLGEHWVTDVIGGALLGFSLALLISFFWISEPRRIKIV